MSLEPLADRWRAFGWGVVEVDGHDVAALLADVSSAAARGRPADLRHRAGRIKGRGVSFIEDRVEWHHRVPTDAELAAALAELARARDDDRRRLPHRVRRDAGRPGRADPPHRRRRATTRWGRRTSRRSSERFPDRLVNVGIAEQNLVGVSAGLASAGKIPFTCGASCFLTGRALEQIKADLAYSRHNVKLCGMSSGMAYGELGPTHHSIEDLAWTRAIANLTVIVPADPIETAQAVRAAAAIDGPVFLRLSRMPVPVVHADRQRVRDRPRGAAARRVAT